MNPNQTNTNNLSPYNIAPGTTQYEGNVSHNGHNFMGTTTAGLPYNADVDGNGNVDFYSPEDGRSFSKQEQSDILDHFNSQNPGSQYTRADGSKKFWVNVGEIPANMIKSGGVSYKASPGLPAVSATDNNGQPISASGDMQSGYKFGSNGPIGQAASAMRKQLAQKMIPLNRA